MNDSRIIYSLIFLIIILIVLLIFMPKHSNTLYKSNNKKIISECIYMFCEEFPSGHMACAVKCKNGKSYVWNVE